ncbi:MAG TPA: acyl-CoA dehydrogenase family protein [Mycobacterium sp.]|nr:acyl-CoA dehydrogenase family protein [Mycobacterium sp.]
MNLELTAEQQALRDTVRRFLAEKADIASYVRKALDTAAGARGPENAEHRAKDEVWRGLADLGATAVLVPPEYGGAGMTMLEAGIVAEQLGAALYPGPWLSCAVAATRALTRTGPSDSAKALLTGIGDGSIIATLGLLAGRRPNATPRGDGWVLRGGIASVPDFAIADVALVLADDPDGAALFAVETCWRGLHFTGQHAVDPTRQLFDVTLEEVPAQRLASVSPDVIKAVTDDVLAAHAADALGAAEAVMRLAVEHAKVRHQFGQPIGSFQAVQHLCVDMYETVELARGGVIHALWAADAAVPEERHLAAVRAKAFAARLATVGDTAIQVLGGIGYTWEHDAHLYLRRLLSWSAFLGSSDEYLTEVGARLAWSVITERVEQG